MGWMHKLYDGLVNRVPGIRYRYQKWRADSHGIGRVLSWGYLLWLNFCYYVLRRQALERIPNGDTVRKVRLPSHPESENGFSLTPEEFVQRLLQADVVSFDVFDTLILRPLREPTDLFYELSHRLGYPGLKRLRIEAEAAARKMKSAEVTLPEIWCELEKMSGIPAQEGMDAEWQTELDFCQANPYFLKVLPLLRQNGKKLIICSDMYLSSSQIRLLLEKCGLGSFEHYFVSGDYGVSKSDGGLFDEVKSVCGQKLRYIHVGDNPHADEKQARQRGFETVLYPNVNTAGRKLRCTGQSPLVGAAYQGIVNGQLYNGLERRSMAYELGFVYGGLLVTGFCQFIHAYAEKERLDRLLFLARDGQILHRAYRTLYPSEAERCEYVLWSRLAAVRLGAGRFRHQFETYMIRNKADNGYTLEQVMDSMLLLDMMPGFLAEIGTDQSDLSLSRGLADRLCRYLRKNWEQVLAHYSLEQEEAKRYYAQALEGAKSAAAIDVGWVGSGPLTLRWLIQEHWKLDCRVSCILAGTVGEGGAEAETGEAELAKGSMVSYLFSSAHNRELWRSHDVALGHNMLIELLLSATTPSFRGFYRRNGDGYAFSRNVENIDAAQVQAGILDFVKLYAAHPWAQVRISGSDAMAPVRLLCQDQRYVRKLIEASRICGNVE